MNDTRMKTHVAQRLSRTSYFGLLILTAAHQLWPVAPNTTSGWLWLVISLAPLLAFGRAIIRREPRGVMLASLVSLLYFCHAVAELMGKSANPQAASVELVLSVLLFFSGVLFARWRSEETAPPVA